MHAWLLSWVSSFLGNLHQLGVWLSPPTALSIKHGPVMLLHLGKIPTIVFSSRPFSYAAHQLLYGGNDMAFAPYGSYWWQARKICILELLSSRRVQSFKPVREEEVGRMIKKISSISSMEEEGKRIDIGHLTKELEELLGGFYVVDYFPSLEWIDILSGKKGRLGKNFKGWDDFLDQVLEEKSRMMTYDDDDQEQQHNNFVQMDGGTHGIQFSRDNIMAILLDMMTGATDTTTTTLEWAMAEFIKNPDAMEKAQAEVRKVVGRRSKVEEDEISQMGYLQAVIKHPFWFHMNPLQGYHIHPKTKVLINAWAIGRDPKSWENAEEFLPERFIDDSTDYKGPDFRFIPFGAGRRGCPGMLFAIPTIELALANLLCWFDWKMPGNLTKDDLDLTEALGAVVHKKIPLQLIPTHHFS
ncbi:hypothetical protein ACLOJK_015708 [Asimina triloba]